MVITEKITNTLVELALKMDAEQIGEFIDAVHRNVKLPGFDEALFIRLCQNADPSARRAAAQILRQQGQPSSFQEMRRETV